MGLFKKVKKGFKKVAKSKVGSLAIKSAATYYGGPTGGSIAAALTSKSPKAQTMRPLPASYFPQSTSSFPPAVSPSPVFMTKGSDSFGVGTVGSIAAGASAVAQMAAPILLKISGFLGRSITFRAVMIVIRRLWKFTQSPQVISAALGITAAELGQLLTLSALKGANGRRMNVGNVKALRRAHRRVEGFHRICKKNDELRAPRRRTSRAAPRVTVCR